MSPSSIVEYRAWEPIVDNEKEIVQNIIIYWKSFRVGKGISPIAYVAYNKRLKKAPSKPTVDQPSPFA